MRFRAVASMLFVVAMLAGCGSSSSSSSTPSGGSASGGGSTSAVGSTSTPSSTSSSSSSSGGFANVGHCSQLAGIGSQFAKAMQAASAGGKLDFTAAASAYQNLANAAPSEIQPDMQVIAHAFSTFAGAISKVGYKPGTVPSATQIAALQTAEQSFTAPSFHTAEQHLVSWAKANCHQ